MNICGNCKFYKVNEPVIVASLEWIEDQQVFQENVLDHTGECESPDNWLPSRGNMPCDHDYRCRHHSKDWKGKDE